MRERPRSRNLATGIAAGLEVLPLWNAGEAVISGATIPVWMIASVTFGIGRAVAKVK